jgi:hypothetical protein
MVMVEIDSNVILVKPITSKSDHKLAQAYRVLMTRLQRAGIVPKKHILDNEVSEATKTIIKNECKMSMELAPPQAVTAGTQQRSPFEISRPIS